MSARLSRASWSVVPPGRLERPPHWHHPFLADGKADLNLGGVALREVRERFAALDLDRRRTVIRALCRVTVDPPEPGVRPTRATARKRVRVPPSDPRSGSHLERSLDPINA